MWYVDDGSKVTSELGTSEGKEWPLEAAIPILLTLKHLPQNLNSSVML